MKISEAIRILDSTRTALNNDQFGQIADIVRHMQEIVKEADVIIRQDIFSEDHEYAYSTEEMLQNKIKARKKRIARFDELMKDYDECFK